MEPERFLEGAILAAILAAFAAYAYYNVSQIGVKKIIELYSEDNAGFDAADAIRGAEVSVGVKDRYIPCQPSPSGEIRRCSSGEWSYVGATAKKMGNKMMKCVWAHPISGKTIKIAFENVSLGGSVSGFYGLMDGSDVENPGTVYFTVNVGGRSSYEGASVFPGTGDFTVTTEPSDRSVEFTITTDSDRRRYFCFDAWSG